MSVCWIPCILDCAYQKDGFCNLEFPVSILDPVANGCVYHKQILSTTNTSKENSPNLWMLQKPHEHFSHR